MTCYIVCATTVVLVCALPFAVPLSFVRTISASYVAGFNNSEAVIAAPVVDTVVLFGAGEDLQQFILRPVVMKRIRKLGRSLRDLIAGASVGAIAHLVCGLVILRIRRAVELMSERSIWEPYDTISLTSVDSNERRALGTDRDAVSRRCLQQADPELRRAVDDLLVHTESEDGPLDRPAWQFGIQQDPIDIELSSGQQLGSYVLEAEIGAGGMGRVYRANDARFNRVVAIKVSGALFSNRFEQEAKTIAALNHPNICQIYDVGPNYLVMEYVDGSPIVVPEQQPMPLPRTLQLAIQIASAIEAAHSRASSIGI